MYYKRSQNVGENYVWRRFQLFVFCHNLCYDEFATGGVFSFELQKLYSIKIPTNVHKRSYECTEL